MWDDSASVKEFLDNGGLATVRLRLLLILSSIRTDEPGS